MRLEEQLDASTAEEGEADLSALGDEELLREAKREIVRRRRSNRKAARVAENQKKAKRSVDIALQVVLMGLLVFAALVATVVVIVGLSREREGLVRIGIAALCAVSGLSLYRLPKMGGR